MSWSSGKTFVPLEKHFENDGRLARENSDIVKRKKNMRKIQRKKAMEKIREKARAFVITA